ncbi:hypothetical protein CY34DRAFT_333912 [Suillus luteus UH-Slu-Lm8-n1]|uniref:Unplaced genomic scaffold CY34scaffold_21, whole genome shotgun sequence n=1 Tax=Suillus luteus UH-Slu-Lm8-n1 TaxID=930992 RepID=A0A0D0AA03_9AGAM|nr:hypothetical protein CY34DRAFT_333912 [Suillus luteus UH-Slu-Lm8-n1]
MSIWRCPSAERDPRPKFRTCCSDTHGAPSSKSGLRGLCVLLYCLVAMVFIHRWENRDRSRFLSMIQLLHAFVRSSHIQPGLLLRYDIG